MHAITVRAFEIRNKGSLISLILNTFITGTFWSSGSFLICCVSDRTKERTKACFFLNFSYFEYEKVVRILYWNLCFLTLFVVFLLYSCGFRLFNVLRLVELYYFQRSSVLLQFTWENPWLEFPHSSPVDSFNPQLLGIVHNQLFLFFIVFSMF